MKISAKWIRRVTILTFVNVLLQTAALAHGVTRYVNGRWFDGQNFVEATWFSVDGVLRRAYEGSQTVTTLDLGGGYVIPPLADAHTHALTAPDRKVIDRFLDLGIFYVKNPNAIARFIPQVRALVNNPESVDALFAAGGVTATGGHPIQIFGSEEENDAYFVADSPEDLDRKWALIRGAGGDFIKAYLEHAEQDKSGRGLSVKTLRRLVERAHADHLRVTVHVNSAFDFRASIESGPDEIAHLPLENLTAEDSKLAAKRKTIVVTTTLSHRAPQSDDLDAIHRHNLQLLQVAGVRLVLGTDSHKSVIDEAINVQRLSGFSTLTVLRMLVEATPPSMFPDRKIGRIAEGYEASFIVLKNDPLRDLKGLREITLRVKEGHRLRTGL